VDSLNSSPGTSTFQTSFEKKDLPFMRNKRGAEDPGPSHNEMAFNPSKTFGGERARMMFMKGEMEEKEGGFNAYDSKRGYSNGTGTGLLPGL
jgi:hypothetical protein